MRCPRCGHAIDDASLAVCPNCGLNLDGVRQLSGAGTGSDTATDAAPLTGGQPAPSNRESAPSSPASTTQAHDSSSGAYPAYPAYPPSMPPGMPAGYAPYSWAAPTPPPPRKKAPVALIVALAAIAAVLIVGGSGVALFSFAQGSRLFAAHARATAVPTPVPTATPVTMITYQNALTSKATGWHDADHCTFQGDGYHIQDNYICFAPVGGMGSLDIAVDAKQISGNTDQGYGIVFRDDPKSRGGTGNHYEFDVTSDGEWISGEVVSDRWVALTSFVANPAINVGANATNRLRVRAVGLLFDFFVNGTQVGHVDGSRFTNGFIPPVGSVGPVGCESCNVVFTNIAIGFPEAS